MRYWKELLVVLFISLLLRLGPVFLFGVPISYDAPFHIRHAESIVSGEGLSLTDSLTGAANYYPPLYHLLLAGFQLMSSIPIEVLAAYLLPFVAALVPLSTFIYLRAVSSERNAIIGAALVAIASPLIAASFDSPENFAFFIFPLVLLLLHKGQTVFAGLLYASLLLWNYFFVVVTLVPLLIAFRKRPWFFPAGILGGLLVAGFHFSRSGFGILTKQSLSSGMDFISSNLGAATPVILLFTVVAVVPIIYFYIEGKDFQNENLNFFILWLLISLIGLGSFVFGPVLRPWEHSKFAALAGTLLLVQLSSSKVKKIYTVLLAFVMLATAIPLSSQVLFPRVAQVDFFAIGYLEERYSGGKILAAPSLSEWVALHSSLDSSLITALYFEGGKGALFSNALYWLQRSSGELALAEDREKGFLEINDIKYILVNFEDEAVRGVDWYKKVAGLDKSYIAGYERTCVFGSFLDSFSYSCGENESAIYSLGKGI